MNAHLLRPKRNHDVRMDVPHTSSVSVVIFKFSRPQLPRPDHPVQLGVSPATLAQRNQGLVQQNKRSER